MSRKKITTEDFIERAKKVHGGEFDYSLLEYKNSKTKLKIICQNNHVTEVLPWAHLNGFKCGICAGRHKTSEDIITEFKKTHGNRYDYSLVEYKGSKSKVKIICKYHNVFEQAVHHHSSGSGCPKCSNIKTSKSISLTTEEFIKRSKEIYGHKYDYSLVEYKNMKTKVKIICDKGHVFEQTPNSHLNGNGCSCCYGRNKTTSDIVKEFKKVNGNKYDYSLVDYINAKTKVTIRCKEHGLFKCIPSNHLLMKGCPKCGNNKISEKLSKNPSGWSKKDWSESAVRSKNFESFKVYVIRCWNDNEEFYKIGRTYRSIKLRFKDNRSMPYIYEVIKEFVFNESSDMEINSINCFNKETDLKRLNKENKYLPKIHFEGKHECFSKINFDILN